MHEVDFKLDSKYFIESVFSHLQPKSYLNLSISLMYQSPRAKRDELNFGLNLEIPTIVILLAMFVHCALFTDCPPKLCDLYYLIGQHEQIS